VKRPDGEISWAVFTAAPIIEGARVTGAVVTFLDITDRKRAEAARAESEARLRSIMESAPSIIVSTDAEGRIVYVNHTPPPFRPEEVLGRYAWEYVAEDEAQRVREVITRVRETRAGDGYETLGSEGRPYAVTVGPIVVGGEVVGLTFIAADQTRAKALEAGIATSHRLASIGTLAAGVAHEINNPVTYLLANLERLERELAGSTIGAEQLDAAKEAALRIRQVIRDLGSFSHVGAGRRVAIDVGQLLDSSLRMAEIQIRCRARVVRDYAAIPLVNVDDSRLGQVFLNLIVNAAQAIPEGEAARHEIRIATREEGDRIRVEISDTGQGIAPDLMDKLFDPFVTTKPAGVGVGLGLYISRNIVVALGGELTVRSAVGVGSTFALSIPVDGPVTDATELEAPGHGAAPSPGIRVSGPA
jgi:PAS domain S-box-containing protein